MTTRVQRLLIQEIIDVDSLQEEIYTYNDSAMQIWNNFLSDSSK